MQAHFERTSLLIRYDLILRVLTRIQCILQARVGPRWEIKTTPNFHRQVRFLISYPVVIFAADKFNWYCFSTYYLIDSTCLRSLAGPIYPVIHTSRGSVDSDHIVCYLDDILFAY